jgi:hypothetical protein
MKAFCYLNTLSLSFKQKAYEPLAQKKNLESCLAGDQQRGSAKHGPDKRTSGIRSVGSPERWTSVSSLRGAFFVSKE